MKTNKTSIRSSNRYGSKGLTLVEVVISLALLSTLLVGMLTAHSKHVRQISAANRLANAVELADRLVADWFLDEDFIPEESDGIFASNPDFAWSKRRSPIGTNNPDLNADVVVLNVFHVEDPVPVLTLELAVSPIEQDADARQPQ